MYNNYLVSPLIAAWEFLPRSSAKQLWESEWRVLNEFMLRNEWKIDIDLKKIVRNQVKTIVITDPNQHICYTNTCFQNMTQYTSEEVMGRKPSFLQGPNTNPAITSQIRNAIHSNKTISTSILNYKKNGTPYICKVEIFSIFNAQQNLVNYLALEEEVFKR